MFIFNSIQRFYKKIIYQIRVKPYKTIFFIVGVLFIFYFVFIETPRNFPTGVLVSIEDGTTLSDVAEYLHERDVIKSPLLFKLSVTIVAGDGGVISGDYFFKERLNVFAIISRITKGYYGLDPVRITIPEGASVIEIALLFEEKFADFDKDEFASLALRNEGYLFPDTYFFLPNVQAPQVYREMRNIFDSKIESILGDIEESDKTLHEIITMASIIEEEASTTEARRIIAGILWKRLFIGMPLQVDAVFVYINGKSTFDLSLEDLAIDSPYNTYKYKGLPPGPITNPGMDSILATLYPEESPYLYYLSDLNSNLYYSATFAEHKQKKARYLR